MPRIDIEIILKDFRTWQMSDAKCKNAFFRQMRDKQYGREPLGDAWLWFHAGYYARELGL